MFAVYNKLLAKFPVATKMVTSGTLFSFGDLITQGGTLYDIVQYLIKNKKLIGLEIEIFSWLVLCI